MWDMKNKAINKQNSRLTDTNSMVVTKGEEEMGENEEGKEDQIYDGRRLDFE